MSKTRPAKYKTSELSNNFVWAIGEVDRLRKLIDGRQFQELSDVDLLCAADAARAIAAETTDAIEACLTELYFRRLERTHGEVDNE